MKPDHPPTEVRTKNRGRRSKRSDRSRTAAGLKKSKRFSIDECIEIAKEYEVAIHSNFDLTRVRNDFESKLQTQYFQVIAQPSANSHVIEEFKIAHEILIAALRALARWSNADFMKDYIRLKLTPESNPYLCAAAKIDAAFRTLTCLAPLLREVVPLPEMQQRIWELLEGKSMSGKELGAALGVKYSSDDPIRQAIARIRKSGRKIENSNGSGYYRPDSPPEL